MQYLNCQILLTVSEVGQVVRSTEKVKESVKFHFYERDNYNINNPSKPKRNVMSEGRAVVEYNPLIARECKRKTVLSPIFTNFAISASDVPSKLNQKVWNGMSQQQRLEWHLSQIAEGKAFSYEVI